MAPSWQKFACERLGLLAQKLSENVDVVVGDFLLTEDVVGQKAKLFMRKNQSLYFDEFGVFENV